MSIFSSILSKLGFGDKKDDAAAAAGCAIRKLDDVALPHRAAAL